MSAYSTGVGMGSSRGMDCFQKFSGMELGAWAVQVPDLRSETFGKLRAGSG